MSKQKKTNLKTKESPLKKEKDEKIYGIIEQAKIQNQQGETVKDFQAIHLLTEEEAEKALNSYDYEEEPNIFLLVPVPIYKTENLIIQNSYSLRQNIIKGF